MAGRLWFGGRCTSRFSEAPLRPDLPLSVRPFNLMIFATGGTPHAGSQHLPVHHQLQELAQTHVHWVGDAIQPSHLLLPLLLPSIFPSSRVFFTESDLCIRWPKYWSFSFSISSSKEYSGLISFRIDWSDLPAVQGTLKSLLQHHSSKASVLQGSALFIVQLSHPYMPTGKTDLWLHGILLAQQCLCF